MPANASLPRNNGHSGTLEDRVSNLGRKLASTIGELIEALPNPPSGPQSLATELGLDKVLASRTLKSIRAGDPMAVVHHAPGPTPMRRIVRAAARRGVPQPLVRGATAAVDEFDQFIREIGDRSALDAIISAWLPEARRDFELRRKQALFRAVSQLKGAAAATCVSTVFMHPSPADPSKLDVVWVMGFLRLQRLRPGVAVKCTSRRIAPADAPRRPRTLAGDTTEDLAGYRLDDFCQSPPSQIEARPSGETVHYILAGDAFGPGSETDLLIAEANLAEMPRYVPAGSGRRGYVFAEISTPSTRLLFDCFVHEDVYPDRDPQLIIHDTVYDGVADLNDRARDADRLEMLETIRPLGRGTGAARDAGVPRYVEMLRHVFTSLEWDESAFRGYRCAIDYPVYGAQVSMAFDPPSAPAG